MRPARNPSRGFMPMRASGAGWISIPPAAALAALTVGAIGVVFGDIGTSPLYAFREALAQAAADGIDPTEILGVLSLALVVADPVVTVKYVLFLMRADNQGEGGVLALAALARRALGWRSRIALVLGAAGAALFYGDAIITPALSVLSAVEGLRTIPGAARRRSTRARSCALTIAHPDRAVPDPVARHRAACRSCSARSASCGSSRSAALGLWHIADEPAIIRVGVQPMACGRLPRDARRARAVRARRGVPDRHRRRGADRRHGAFRRAADPARLVRRSSSRRWCSTISGRAPLRSTQLEAATARGAAVRQCQDWFFLMAPEALRPRAGHPRRRFATSSPARR